MSESQLQGSTPSIGAKAGKVWGDTKLVFCWNSIEAHAIFVKKGGYCSCHCHRCKFNRFFVFTGRLAVRIYPAGGGVDETIMGPGDVVDVPPVLLHEFEALEDTCAAEFYWTPLDPNDIDRGDSVGGMKE